MDKFEGHPMNSNLLFVILFPFWFPGKHVSFGYLDYYTFELPKKLSMVDGRFDISYTSMNLGTNIAVQVNIGSELELVTVLH
jgi:hypothetical protein